MARRYGGLFASRFGSIAAAVAVALALAGLPLQAGAASPNLVVSQVYGGGGNSGATLTHDYIELFNRGDSPVSVAGWSVQYASAAGSTWQVTPLSGSVQPGQYYLVQQAAGAGGTTPLPAPDASGSIFMSATSAKVALSNTTTALTGTCPSGSAIVDFVGYGSASCFEGSGPAPTLSNTTAALRAGGGCTDTDSNAGDFSAAPPNPRNASSPTNTCSGEPPPPPPEPQCGDPATPLHDIQGSGLQSPLAGQPVAVEAVVVGDFQGPGEFGGYHLQEEDGDVDGDAATSEGIFVFNGFPVSAGDLVRVSGTVTEFPAGSGTSLTELTGVTDVTVCSSAHAVTPASPALPVPALDHWERFEGMLVHIADDLTVTENFNLGRFGEVDLSAGGRLLQPTQVTSPGPSALALQDLNDRSRIRLDDGNNQQNIDPTRYPAGGLSASNTLRSGATVEELTGVLEQRFGAYRIQPVGPVDFVASNPRPGAPDDVGGRVVVASFNVLNYFNGDGLGGGFPTSRGANNPTELARQRDKIVSAITTMDADIVGLMEIENDGPPNSAIEDLVDGLNSAAGAGTYDFIDTGVVGSDEIRVAIVYQPREVTPAGPHAILDSSVHPLFDDTKSRPVVAQTFEDNELGARVTVAVNHLKSKGSPCDDVGDPDVGDGQGNCNVTRTRAAMAMAEWLETDPTGSGDPDVLITGDLNSYAREDPIRALADAGYVNLIEEELGPSAYSFVFQGQSGYLDHALASSTLASQVTDVTEWHINADEPRVLDYNLEFKSANHQTSLYSPDAYRSSDHDAVIVGLDLTWPFDGFFPPVANPPAENIVQAGSRVPVRFSLSGDRGSSIFASGFPKSHSVPCEPGAPSDDPDPSSTDGRLNYDAEDDAYTYVWDTPREWSGTCRLLVVKLRDGSEHEALFRFR